MRLVDIPVVHVPIRDPVFDSEAYLPQCIMGEHNFTIFL